MYNIAEALNAGTLISLEECGTIFKVCQGQYVEGQAVMHGADQPTVSRAGMTHRVIEPEDAVDAVVLNDKVVYQDDQKGLQYTCLGNTRDAGVNFLCFDLNEINLEQYQYLISSGGLSGCTFAWFLLDGNRLLLLHSGKASGDDISNSESEEVILERRRRVYGDFLNALKVIFNPESEEEEEEDEDIEENDFSPEKLLEVVDRIGSIRTGQIICHVLNSGDKGIFLQSRKIQLLTYNFMQHYSLGECLCSVEIAEEGRAVSGMIAAFDYNNIEAGPHSGRFITEPW